MSIIIYGGQIEVAENYDVDAEVSDAPRDDFAHFDPCQPSTVRTARGIDDGANYNKLQSTTDWMLGAGLWFVVALVVSAAVVGGLFLFGVL